MLIDGVAGVLQRPASRPGCGRGHQLLEHPGLLLELHLDTQVRLTLISRILEPGSVGLTHILISWILDPGSTGWTHIDIMYPGIGSWIRRLDSKLGNQLAL